MQAPKSLDAIIYKCIKSYESKIFKDFVGTLNSKSKAYLDGLMIIENNKSIMSWIRSWPYGISVNSILGEINKLDHLKLLDIKNNGIRENSFQTIKKVLSKYMYEISKCH